MGFWGPPKVFAFDHPRAGFLARLDAFLDAHEARWRARQARIRATAALPWAGLLALAWKVHALWHLTDLDFPADLFDEEGLGFAFLIGFLALVLGGATIGLLEWAKAPDPTLVRARALHAALTGLMVDVHPRAPVRGVIDLGDPTGTTPRREARSPYSGARKRYYRHPWLRLTCALADGTCLTLAASSHVKTKGGTRVREELTLRGRIAAPGRATPRAGTEGGVRAVGLTGPTGPQLGFEGPFPAVGQLPALLAALLARARG